MQVIVPCNNKGGVGKTSVSSFLGDYFAKILQRKTLLIDFDAQCNLSQRYLRMEMDPSNPEGHIPPPHPDYDEKISKWKSRSSIADIFLNPDQGVIPYPTVNKYLDIMPAHASHLLEIEQCQNLNIEKIYDYFTTFILQSDIQSEYEFLIIDTAPSKGPLTRAAVRVATHILIPTIMEDKPLKGVFGMLQLWMQEAARRNNKNPLNLLGVLANFFDNRTTLHKDIYMSLIKNNEISDFIMPCKLSRLISFAESDHENSISKSLFDLPNSNKAKKEVTKFCEFISEKLNIQNKTMKNMEVA